MSTNPASRPHTFSGRIARRPRRLISLTPLIDVVFILLLFFMLASNFIHLHEISLDAPASGASPTSAHGAMLVEVRLDGVRLAGQYMPLEKLAERVKTRLADHPDQRVLVQSGSNVKLQHTVRVLDRLSATGVTHLSLLPTPGSPPLVPPSTD